MATLREYYDSDFNYTARVHIQLPVPDGAQIEGAVLYDFAANTAFLICYVPAPDRSFNYFLALLQSIAPGGQVSFDGRITLPSARQCHFLLRLESSVRNPTV